MSYIDDLKKVVEVNSYTNNKEGVNLVGEIFDEWLQALGFEVTIYKRDTIGDHRYYQSLHVNNAPKLLLLGHIDTVFPPGKFEYFTEDDEWVYGPGVCDMKGGNIVLLEALRQLTCKGLKIQNIDILFVSDEETGSDDSKYLTAELSRKYDYCFVYEAAGVNLELVTGRKGVGTFFYRYRRKSSACRKSL